MRLDTEMDKITCHTRDATIHVRSTVQSLRLVKNLVDMLYGGGELQLAYLWYGKTGHVSVRECVGEYRHIGGPRAINGWVRWRVKVLTLSLISMGNSVENRTAVPFL